ncbi:hypothetical protein SAICODRAFT_71117 [Saitoella complicata NRRL Y-17804]|uniref:Uncharacterized protein n=1 Tax=Saitoella complicata (strain BCRC 22490 / CBS 7301 / JCM 7358 / NBRC 10748 / NRRL Y-17804) TaxID=698492 RepID=A0A0E9N9Z8_SAICN|nr:uncharacterized protein SAICODRAFT_71117 [Saitoella complicata NRRL Y-17804]ODQ53108.1 hypothetical protein SAICODRAFT_71117 [Saitoella complicata NRRL Y-17804]GAO46230.1 hypothetical protein G7K_0465-t1 [Saitoella complicata NRRL Y-17804]
MPSHKSFTKKSSTSDAGSDKYLVINPHTLTPRLTSKRSQDSVYLSSLSTSDAAASLPSPPSSKTSSTSKRSKSFKPRPWETLRKLNPRRSGSTRRSIRDAVVASPIKSNNPEAFCYTSPTLDFWLDMTQLHRTLLKGFDLIITTAPDFYASNTAHEEYRTFAEGYVELLESYLNWMWTRLGPGLQGYVRFPLDLEVEVAELLDSRMEMEMYVREVEEVVSLEVLCTVPETVLEGIEMVSRRLGWKAERVMGNVDML